jgi:hypothetical protein
VSQAKSLPGWDEDRVWKVIEHYEKQSEDEAPFEDEDQTFIEVPNGLVPGIRSLLARHRARA